MENYTGIKTTTQFSTQKTQRVDYHVVYLRSQKHLWMVMKRSYFTTYGHKHKYNLVLELTSQAQWHAVSFYSFSQYNLKCHLSDVHRWPPLLLQPCGL